MANGSEGSLNLNHIVDSMSEQAAQATSISSPPKPVLALPAPPPHDPDAPIKLNVGTSEPVSLYDKLGPTIVASDGSEYPFELPLRHQRATDDEELTFFALPSLAALSRIGNWAEMDELERSRVLRVLGARNKIRLEGKKAELEKLEQESGAEQLQ